MEEKNLKTCPFCGGENIELIACIDEMCYVCAYNCETCEDRTYAYCCSRQKHGCGAVGGWHTTIKKARAAWNRRTNNE